MIKECKKGLELIEKKADELKLIITLENTVQRHIECVQYVFNEIKKSRELIKKTKTFEYLVLHIVQPYWIKFEIDINECVGKFNNRNKSLAEICLMHKSFFIKISGLIELVYETVEMGKNKTIEEYNYFSNK